MVGRHVKLKCQLHVPVAQPGVCADRCSRVAIFKGKHYVNALDRDHFSRIGMCLYCFDKTLNSDYMVFRKRIIEIFTEDKYYRWLLFGLVIAGGTSFLLAFLLVWAGPLRALFPDPLYFPGRDFQPPYDTALSFLKGQDPATLYFVYFPLTIFFYLPLSYLSFNQAFIAMTLWNLLMALVLAIVAVKILKYYQVSLPAGTAWLLFLVYIFFCPATAELTSANVNTLVACFVALFYYFLFVKQKNVLAAVCLVVATLFKIFPAFLILVAILDRRYKFVWIFLATLALCAIASVLLLGIPAHLNWVGFLASGNQGGPALTYGHNATITAILYKSMQLFGMAGEGPSILFSIIWLIVRVAIVILILCLLFPIFRKKDEGLDRNRWIILTFSLFSVLMISLPNTAWVYYATCLALPFILCIFCLKLNLLDRILIALSLAFFSFNTHIANLAGFIGGSLGSFFYLLHPAAIGNLLFLTFIVIYMIRLKRGGTADETLNRNSRLQ